MAEDGTPLRSARVTTPTYRHQHALMASPPRVGYPSVDTRASLATAGEDVLFLECAGGELMGTVVVEHHAADPGGPVAPAGAVGDPDEMVELRWLINSARLVVDHSDLGFDPVPDLGLAPGWWQVRAAVWGRDAAEAVGEAWEERLAEDDEALDPDLVETPLSPEIWLVQLWPTPAAGAAGGDTGPAGFGAAAPES